MSPPRNPPKFLPHAHHRPRTETKIEMSSARKCQACGEYGVIRKPLYRKCRVPSTLSGTEFGSEESHEESDQRTACEQQDTGEGTRTSVRQEAWRQDARPPCSRGYE